MGTVRTRSEIRRRHVQAKKEFLQILREADRALSTQEVIARHRKRRRSGFLTGNELCMAMWALVEDGTIERTVDQKLRLVAEGGGR